MKGVALPLVVFDLSYQTGDSADGVALSTSQVQRDVGSGGSICASGGSIEKRLSKRVSAQLEKFPSIQNRVFLHIRSIFGDIRLWVGDSLEHLLLSRVHLKAFPLIQT